MSLTFPYDWMKERMWITFGEMDNFNIIVALFFSAFCSTSLVLPFDNIKTRMMI